MLRNIITSEEALGDLPRKLVKKISKMKEPVLLDTANGISKNNETCIFVAILNLRFALFHSHSFLIAPCEVV